MASSTTMNDQPKKKTSEGLQTLLMLATSLGVFLLLFAGLEVWGGWISTIGTIPLEQGYSLKIEEDSDVAVFLGTLRGPGMASARSFLCTGRHDGTVPHFVAENSTDGSMGWVVAAEHPDVILFSIDYRTGAHQFGAR